MRKLLLILLLAIMPLQATWAVASAYCQHEQGGAVAHFGHHDLACSDAKLPLLDGEKNQPDEVPLAGGECECCHGGIVAVTPALPELAFVPPAKEALKGVSNLLFPEFTSNPERPNWPALA